MAKEIERKFLVCSDSFKELSVSSIKIIQGYIFNTSKGVLRVRIKGNAAYITFKSANTGIVRNEWEYPIPVNDATEMLGLAGGGIIEKTRYIVPFDGNIWEVDVFEGRLEGLILAEIELPDEETKFVIPPFVGKEVSNDHRYFNSSLAGSLAD